jgi:hypothetical protein
MTQTPSRDWQKDMEMCEAATRGPWKVFKGVVETLIGTAYDHPQMKGPDSIVGHAISAHGHYVYIRENDATLLAVARTALPYWLQEAKTLQEIASGRGREALRLSKLLGDLNDELTASEERADIAEAREQRLKEAIELAIRDGGKYENPYESLITLQSFLSTLYPDTSAPTPKEDLK